MKQLIDILEGLLTSKNHNIVYKSPIVILFIKMLNIGSDIINYRDFSANVLASLHSDKSRYTFKKYIRIPDRHKDPKPFIIARAQYASGGNIYYFILGNMPGTDGSVYLVRFNKWNSGYNAECIEYKDVEEFLRGVYGSNTTEATYMSNKQDSIIYTINDPGERKEIAEWLEMNSVRRS